jgi:hypothetical protein
MSLSSPTERAPRHIRRVSFLSFERRDGLIDIEGELLDSKAVDTPRPSGLGVHKAGAPVHHMLVRVTIDRSMVVHAVEVAMDSHPFGGCTGALTAMQSLVGHSMGKGWRQAIRSCLEGVAGCTHIRELLQGMGTAAFQTVVPAFDSKAEQSPAFIDQCAGWDATGASVMAHFPRFHRKTLPDLGTD